MGKPPASARRVRLHFAAGFAAAALLLFVGEAGLRVAPPRTIQPYLPDDNRPGPFRSDPYYGVQYESWDAFRADYADGLKPHEFLFDTPDPPKTWAMFGSSFVHAPGMLADTAREFVPNRHIFNLGRNEFLYVRAAQVDLLLAHGLRPERIVFAMQPLDAAVFAHQTVEMVHAGPGRGPGLRPPAAAPRRRAHPPQPAGPGRVGSGRPPARRPVLPPGRADRPRPPGDPDRDAQPARPPATA